MRKKLFLFCIAGFSASILLSQQKRMFSLLPSTQAVINFNNKLVENAEHNIITYEYFYNGGGVAAGDFNNDGLLDLYFTSKQQAKKLYLNKFDFDTLHKRALT